MLWQCMYEIILFFNYFITVVYYYHTHPILFLYFFHRLYLFNFSKIFSLLVFCSFMEFTISYQIQRFISTYNIFHAIAWIDL